GTTIDATTSAEVGTNVSVPLNIYHDPTALNIAQYRYAVSKVGVPGAIANLVFLLSYRLVKP
ncbi:hypothetical protein, partial [Oculatella sp. LEGE 06141]